MGLANRRHSSPESGLKPHAHWLVPAALTIASTLIALSGDRGRELLRYDRPMIADGEAWRLLTGHFAHLNDSHLLLNLAGLLLSWALVGRNYSVLQWLLVVTLSLATTSVGLWFLDSDMLWYVGLSGALHGILLAGAIGGLRSRPTESIVICVLIATKLAYEQALGPLPGSESASGGVVAVNAHLFGAFGGAMAAGIVWRGVRKPASI